MSNLKRITVLVTDEEYEELQRMADGRPLSSWIKKTMLAGRQIAPRPPARKGKGKR